MRCKGNLFIMKIKQNSKIERDMKKLSDSSFVYGEIVTYL